MRNFNFVNKDDIFDVPMFYRKNICCAEEMEFNGFDCAADEETLDYLSANYEIEVE